MDESPECWTNHHSIIEFKNQWYLFYHNSDLSPHFDKNRSIRSDSLFFNEDGTIKKVKPTLRGVGITDASQKIQIDRYSLKSDKGGSIDFLDTLNTFGGWKTILDTANAWIQYNSVDFENNNLKLVSINATSRNGASISIRLNKVDGPLLAQIGVGKTPEWNVLSSKLVEIPSGIHNLVVVLNDESDVEINWVSFE
ncbi:MAG: carbohydrate-binding protein [Ignavibacteria bacterium]|jgi:hypothetical protein